MVSGYGVHGGKGRCYQFWQDFVQCMNANKAGGVNAYACKPQHSDYIECLHHSKLSERNLTIRAEMEKRQKAGTLPADVEALLKEDFKTGVSK